MTARQQLEATLAGEQGPIPTLFWKHFGQDEQLGDAAIEAHERWLAQTNASLVKVMNEQLYPHGEEFRNAAQWGSVPAYPASHPAIQDEVQLVRDLVARHGATHHVLVTVHGLVASAFHARGGGADYDEKRHQLVDALRANPAEVAAAYDRIGGSLVEHVHAYLDAGADGIFLAALGGERSNYSDDEFAEHVRPHDLAILEAAGSRGALRFLHICKDGVNLERFVGYEAEIVHVGEHINDFTLEEVRRRFPNAVVAGGVNNADPYFTTGAETDIPRIVESALAGAVEPVRFMLCADCSLPDPTPGQWVGRLTQAFTSQTNQ